MTTISKIGEKLRDPEYRKAFVSSQINIGLPFQLRALLKARGKTQEWLAAKTGMLQPRISGLLSPGKTRPNIETLRRLAEAFDCGLAVRFVPFSELVGWSEAFDPESFIVPNFEDDKGFEVAPNDSSAVIANPSNTQEANVTYVGTPGPISADTTMNGKPIQDVRHEQKVLSIDRASTCMKVNRRTMNMAYSDVPTRQTARLLLRA